MRFGIMGMQLDSLIPPGLPPGAVLQHIMQFDHAAVVSDLHGHGLNPIELGGDLQLFLPQSFAPPAIEALARLKEEQGVTYTVHLPLWSTEPSTPLGPVRRGSVEALLDTIRAVQPLEPEVYVVHATGSLAAEFYQMQLLGAGRDLIVRQFQMYAMESLRVLLAESGVPLAQAGHRDDRVPLRADTGYGGATRSLHVLRHRACSGGVLRPD